MSQPPAYWLGEDDARELTAGQVVVLSPLCEGRFRSSQLGPLTLHHFRFSPELAGGLLTPPEHDIFETQLRQPLNALRCLPADSPGALAWTQLLSQPSGGSTLRQRVELLRIVAAVFTEELQQPVSQEGAFLSARQKLRLLLNQIPESEFLGLTPRDLAAHCGVTIAQAGRSFRQMFGLSLRRRQELIRLQRARQALTETGESLEELAIEAGYKDIQTFIAAFKKSFGVSPSEWRHPRLHRENGAHAKPEPEDE